MWFMRGEIIQFHKKKKIRRIYDDAINDLTSNITPSNVFNVRINKSQYPLHGQRWSHNDKLV